MTEKKEKILHEALELFANEGYQSTPTSKIACQAEVSEGLIFRHFQSKEGLLKAVVNLADEDIKGFIERMKQQEDPKKVIETAFEFPPLVSSNRNFWKLQFSLKYQCPAKSSLHEKPVLKQTVETMLEKAFADLNYDNPQMEAQLLMIIIRDLCNARVNSAEGFDEKFINFVKQRYGL